MVLRTRGRADQTRHPRRRIPAVENLGIGLLLAAVLPWQGGARGDETPADGAGYRIGEVVHSFTARTVDGKTLELNAYRGKYLLLCFWASWCGHCRTELPRLAALHEKYESENLAFLSVSLDFRQTDLAAALEEYRIGFPVVFSGQGWSDERVKAFHVNSIPRNYILDDELRIIAANLHGVLLERVLDDLSAGRTGEALARSGRAIREEVLLEEIRRLRRAGREEEAKDRIREFLRLYPHSQNAGVARAYALMSESESLDNLSPPYELRPPDFAVPQSVRLPGFRPGSGGYRTEAQLRILARALEEYHRATGRYPEALEVLTYKSTYLPDVPEDPFGGEFRYHTDGWSVWILAGMGPDGRIDIDVESFTGDPAVLEGLLFLPSSGADTGGDIVAYKSP